MTRRYGKPIFGLDTTSDRRRGQSRSSEEYVWTRPFCKLLRFNARNFPVLRRSNPKLLIVAPLSGHYATLLRGTVEAFLPASTSTITDWTDARMVPGAPGASTSTTISTTSSPFAHRPAGARVHLGVCQPAVPLHRGRGARWRPRTIRTRPPSMTLMGGPIDTRRSPDRRSTSSPQERARLVPAATASTPCPFPIRAWRARSIRASCSCRASWP